MSELKLARLPDRKPVKMSIIVNPVLSQKLGAYAEAYKKAYGDELVALTSSSYEFRTRVNAMAALRRIDYCSPALVGDLVDGLLNPNTRLSGPARDLLGYFYAQDKWHRVIGDHIRAGHWTGWKAGALSGFSD